MNQNRNLYAEQITVSAVCIGMAVILSMLKLFEMPFGGSITLFSMLVICIPGLRYNLKIGVMAGIAYGLLQYLLHPYFLSPLQFLFDYILAFGIMGISGLHVFKTMKYGVVWGYFVAIVGRFIFAALAGYFFWREPESSNMAAIIYTIQYNASYIFAEGFITIVVLFSANNLKKFKMIFNR